MARASKQRVGQQERGKLGSSILSSTALIRSSYPGQRDFRMCASGNVVVVGHENCRELEKVLLVRVADLHGLGGLDRSRS